MGKIGIVVIVIVLGLTVMKFAMFGGFTSGFDSDFDEVLQQQMEQTNQFNQQLLNATMQQQGAMSNTYYDQSASNLNYMMHSYRMLQNQYQQARYFRDAAHSDFERQYHHSSMQNLKQTMDQLGQQIQSMGGSVPASSGFGT